jgi:predicted patatin/cPLA2 family phospholipase
MTVLKAVVVKMMRRSEKVTEERDHKITALMQMNRELENREEQWKERI